MMRREDAMSMKQTALFFTIILVFGVVSRVVASTYLIQSAPTSLSAFDESGSIHWSELFDSIEQYTSGSRAWMYTHSEAAGGAALDAAVNGDVFFAGHQGIGSVTFNQDDIHLRFETFGSMYCEKPANVPLPASLWFLFSGFGTLLAIRRWWRW